MRRAFALAGFVAAVVLASAVPARAGAIGVEEGDCGQIVIVAFGERIGDYDNVWCGPPPE